MKKKDLIITAYLRQNARVALTTLSRRTGVPVSTIFDRLRLNQGNLIQRHVALIDFSLLGFSTRAQVMVRISKKDREGIKEYLLNHFNVNSLYKVNNGYDFIAECIFKNVKDLEEFIEGLEDRFTVKAKEVHYIVDDLKKESFLSDPGCVELL